MSNIQNAMETELPLWGEQGNGPREQGDQRVEWQETAAEACPQEGGHVEMSTVFCKSMRGEGVSINPSSASKRKKAFC